MEECIYCNSCKQMHCDEGDNCLIKIKLNYLYDTANIAPRFRKKQDLFTDADGTDTEQFLQLKEIQDNISDFVNEGHQLYLHSQTCGCGKTSWAYRLVQAYFNKIWFTTSMKCRALFVNVPIFLTQLKEDINNPSEELATLKENIENCDLVIWDDIGTKMATAYEMDKLMVYVESRLLKGKANIFTANLSDEELHAALGDRLASRITGLDYNIEFKGGDKRSYAFKKEN